MANLNHLAPELLIIILSSTESSKDLHKLISASSACFRAFVLNRNTILLSILRNAVEPSVFREMLAISHVPSLASFTDGHRRSTTGPSDSPTDTVKLFLEHYFSNREFDIPSETTRIVSMSRLYNMVSRISDEFFSQASRLLMGDADVPSLDGHNISPLSTTEKTRIQRAFFRYELYTKVFPTRENGWKSLFDARAQFDLFIRHLAAWEVEEMSCVYVYLEDLAAGYFNDFEEQIIHAFLSCSGAREALRRLPSPPRRLVTAGDSDPFISHHGRRRSSSPTTQKDQDGIDENYYAFTKLDLLGLDIFEDAFQSEIPKFISSLTSHGLEFSLSLMDANAEKRKDLIRAKAPFGGEGFASALSNSPQHLTPNAYPITGQDDPSFPNTGYCAFHRPDITVYSRIGEYDPFRELGYVFWDKARLETPNARESLARASNVSSEETDRRTWWENKPSVEVRLRGVTVPGREWKKVVERFTSNPDGYYGFLERPRPYRPSR